MREGNSLLCKANEKYYYALRKKNVPQRDKNNLIWLKKN